MIQIMTTMLSSHFLSTHSSSNYFSHCKAYVKDDVVQLEKSEQSSRKGDIALPLAITLLPQVISVTSIVVNLFQSLMEIFKEDQEYYWKPCNGQFSKCNQLEVTTKKGMTMSLMVAYRTATYMKQL